MGGNWNIHLAVTVLACACAAVGQDTSGLTFKFHTLNIKGSQETDVLGISNSGAVVGSYIDNRQNTFKGDTP